MNTQPTSTPRPGSRAGGFLAVIYGILAYLAFAGSFGVYWIAFLADRWVPVTVNRRPGGAAPAWLAVAVDLGLVLLFGLQHSVMARPAFKRWWARWVPPAVERSTYVLVASLLLGLLMALWQPLPRIVWQVESGLGATLLWSLFALALPLTLVASFQIDHFELLGLRQVWAHFRGRTHQPPRFVEPWLYRIVRHPLQLGVLLMLWPLPTMTAGHLLLASSMTLYILVGLYFEERDLIARFGQRYRSYRQRVPGLLPVPVARLLSSPLRVSAARTVLLALAAGALAAALAVVGGCGAEVQASGTGGTRQALWSGEHERSFVLYRPRHLAEGAPLFLVLHGSGGDASRIRGLTASRFERLADEHGFVVVYPEGFEGNWNGCREQAPFSANRLGVDDVGFVRDLVADLRLGNFSGSPLGAHGVFAFGFSGGGHLALRLALEAPELVSGVAVVGASLPPAHARDCPLPGRLATPVLLVEGTDDPINPYRGGEVVLPAELGGAALGPVLSAEETARYLASRAGHRSPPRVEAGREVDGDPTTGIERRTWRTPGTPPITLITVIGGGHTIPQPGASFPAIVGRQTAELDAPAEVWEFFAGLGATE
jgi:poly(3-hydroxybutyrate) depolymerase/protein-S-isoprenylcysteine O-methyltransferase Ste14